MLLLTYKVLKSVDLDCPLSAGLGQAAASLQQVAATGQEALGPAVGQLGGACKACHDTYRAPE